MTLGDDSRDWPCASCHHIHTANGCTGPASPSDLWAGVTPAACDCDETPKGHISEAGPLVARPYVDGSGWLLTPAPRAALTADPSEGESRGE